MGTCHESKNIAGLRAMPLSQSAGHQQRRSRELHEKLLHTLTRQLYLSTKLARVFRMSRNISVMKAVEAIL